MNRRRDAPRILATTVSLVVLGLSVAGAASGQTPSPGVRKPTNVLFMCPHGAAKSVLASAYFEQYAKERGLNVRVVSAGIDPDENVAPAVAAHLFKSGYPVPTAKPRRVTDADFRAADLVISIGCDVKDLPAQHPGLLDWSDVPDLSAGFGTSDAKIREHVLQLVDELVRKQHR